MSGKLLGDSTPVSPLDFEAEDDASSVQSTLSQQATADVDETVKVSAAVNAECPRRLLQLNSQRLASLRLTQHEVEWQVLEEQMRPRAVLPRFPAWLGPSSLGGACFQDDFQMLEQEAVLGEAMKGDVHRCINISSDSASQQPNRPLEVLIRPLISHDSRRSIAQQRRILEKLTGTATGAIQLQRAYADSHRAYLVFRAPEDGCCLSNVRPIAKQGSGATALAHAVMKALSEVHAAGVCLLDIRADSIWLSHAGAVTFLDFSMAHEFVPGEAERVCALPALRLTQQHAAPEVVSSSLASDVSGRLTPFNGPKADVWAVGQILGQVLRAADTPATTQVKQTPPFPSALQRLLTEMVAEEPAARPDASQALQQCRDLLQC